MPYRTHGEEEPLQALHVWQIKKYFFCLVFNFTNLPKLHILKATCLTCLWLPLTKVVMPYRNPKLSYKQDFQKPYIVQWRCQVKRNGVFSERPLEQMADHHAWRKLGRRN